MYTERCAENTQVVSNSGRMKTQALVQEGEEKELCESQGLLGI